MLTVEEAAEAMGMKDREILEVRNVDGGTYVQTHDRNWTYINSENGAMEHKVEAPTARRVTVEMEPKPEPKADTKTETRSPARKN